MSALRFVIVLIAILITALTAIEYWRGASQKAGLNGDLWSEFKEKFVSNGRVVDKENGGISHSEGQGYGMILAEAAGDRQVFESLFSWTQNNLQRGDGLLSWRWEQGKGVTDQNNATDGDILVAWALLRGAERWDEPRFMAEANTLLEAIKRNVIVEFNGRPFILPGIAGFERQDGLVLNLSYWVYPALDDFAARDDRQVWMEVSEAGVWLTQQSVVGAEGLAPDWVLLTNTGPRPAPGFQSRFSWDAVRVPLYIVWGAENRHWLLAPYKRFWQRSMRDGELPAWIDVLTGQRAAYSAPCGIRAIAEVTTGNPISAERCALEASSSYYSSALVLLAMISATESGKGLRQ